MFKFLATGSLLLAMLAPVAPVVHGQAAHTGADTPDAATLLKQARAAFTQAGSAHVVIHSDAAISGAQSGTVSEQLAGDMSWRAPVQAQLTGTISVQGGGIPISVPVLNAEIRYAQKTLAVHMQGRPWSCVNSKALLPTNFSPLGAPAMAPPGSKTANKKAVMVGPDTVNGVAVWHVSQSGSVATKATKKKVKVATTSDVYITQSGSTIVRISNSSTVTLGKQVIRETGSLDFTNYGEAVSVVLPDACNGTGGTRASSVEIPTL